MQALVIPIADQGNPRTKYTEIYVNPFRLMICNFAVTARGIYVPYHNHVCRRMGMSPSHNQAMRFNCDGAVNAMAMNKDMTQVVVAGRTVFKIISIEEDHFSELVNLRVGKVKNINLTYSAADVAWNHNDENLLASAATNGAVVIWNLSRQVKSKQDCVFTEHKRSVNRVVFHNTEAYQLLSGSQDGTMMLHDLRKRQVSSIFTGRSTESVRDIQFSPPNLGYFTFAAAYENGIVQIWDMRRPDRCEKQFTAHNEPVFSLDWHPEDKSWLATAGRDKMIKVWDVSKQPAQLVYNVQTIASVGRIKWRPQRRYHIANCSLLLDHSINVWDVRRPFIPFANFDEHKDVATCVLWKDDPHVFLSTGKDQMLIQHLFNDAKRPADSVIPSGIDISIYGDMCHATRDKNNARGKEVTSKLSVLRKPNQSRSEQFFTQANSSLTVFQHKRDTTRLEDSMEWYLQSACEDVSMMSFLDLAKSYQLKGRTTEELCRQNAAVASFLNKQQIASSWLLLGILYSKTIVKSSLQVPRRVSVTPTATDTEKGKFSVNIGSPDVEQSTVHIKAEKDKIVEISTGTEDESDGESSEYEKKMSNIASGHGTSGDFFFGDGDTDVVPYTLGINVHSTGEDWSHLPPEAFQPRHEITGHTTPPDRFDGTDHDALHIAAIESDITLPTPTETELREQYLNLSIDVSSLPSCPAHDFTPIVVELIRYFAEQGDVQTCVSMLIVLGDHVRSHIEEESQENWFLSYIDLLGHFELWPLANEIISLSHLPQVNQLNQVSTTTHTACPQCSRVMERTGWLCDRCKTRTNLCSICHLPVKGEWVWCQGCCHGGHMQHMQEFFQRYTMCPAGCGHHCEYT
ncbi:hypothetical protein C0Q70_09773 [Pomacea canaliculata]|uniref:GATOR2 complex protein WDR24 n=1 Tax=Pomacea canaliculata TaxID=400727 RepID=A0A2T7PAR7_POMCA|nr:hypothetical protein C0Q70_09773 [Pomacea canaliculata]